MSPRAPRSRRLVLGAAAVAALVILAGLAVLLLSGRAAVSERLAPLVERYNGTPAVGGDWTLTDMDGRSITQAAPAGTVTAIFFGFTHCPDACPTALLKMAQALDRLPEAQQARVRPLFVSVDPERDDAATLKGYVTLFHPRLLAATASPEVLAAMARAFRAYYRKVELDGGDYTIDHTTYLYLMDGAGHNLAVFGPDTTAETLAKALGEFLAAMAD
jgi:protein SCO1/2